MQTAPEHIQFAYAKLTEWVFCHIRNGSALDQRQLHDLADAMHNVSGILHNYGSWIDDSRYRDLYLRPYDSAWGDRGLKLEERLEDFISIYKNEKTSAGVRHVSGTECEAAR